MSHFDFDRGSARWTHIEERRAVLRRLVGFFLVMLVPLVAGPTAVTFAQGLPPAPPEMEALMWLEGKWEGSGWIEYAPGQRAEFEGTERVESRMGGRVLVVEGEFTAWMGPERGDVPVHQALGVISYDQESDTYLFRTYTARGGNGEAHPAEVTEGRMVWRYDDPRQGRVRYTITRAEDGAWHEVGEASRDGGESWEQFFEMSLERVGETHRQSDSRRNPPNGREAVRPERQQAIPGTAELAIRGDGGFSIEVLGENYWIGLSS